MDINGMIEDMNKLHLLIVEIDNEMYRLASNPNKTEKEVAQFDLLTHLKRIYDPEYFKGLE